MASHVAKVFNEDGVKVFDTTKADAEMMVALRQVKRLPGTNKYRLLKPVSQLNMRTRISQGGVRAAIGMSQVYTLTKHGKVHDFKYIDPVDKFFFGMAATDSISANHKASSSTMTK